MINNIGSVDRILRLGVGVVLMLAPFITGLSLFESTTVTIVSVVVGLILATTAIFKFCPAYRLLGIRTCKV